MDEVSSSTGSSCEFTCENFFCKDLFHPPNYKEFARNNVSLVSVRVGQGCELCFLKILIEIIELILKIAKHYYRYNIDSLDFTRQSRYCFEQALRLYKAEKATTRNFTLFKVEMLTSFIKEIERLVIGLSVKRDIPIYQEITKTFFKIMNIFDNDETCSRQ